MKFRPTKWKIIFSILIPLIIWIFIIITSSSRTFITSLPGFLTNFFDLHDFRRMFSFGNILLFIIEFAVVYLIFSLFQRKDVSVKNANLNNNFPVAPVNQPPAVQPPVNEFNLTLPSTNPNFSN